MRHRSRCAPRTLLVLLLMVPLLLVSLVLSSCGDNESSLERTGPGAREGSGDGYRELSVEERKELGNLMMHRNQVEGEITEPLEVVLLGEVISKASTGEEMIVLIKVEDFRAMGRGSDSVKVAPETQLTVRMRDDEESRSLKAGDRIEVGAILSRSREGPVLLGRGFKRV